MNAATPALPTTGIAETIAEAFDNLRSQGRRSLLALLGIVIGTASIIAMVNVGHMAQLESLKLFSRMGVDMVQVQALPSGEAPAGFPRALVDELPARIPQVAAAIPLAVGRGSVRSGAQQADLGIVGMPPALTTLAQLRIASGRAIGAIDDCAQVAMVGDTAAAKLSSPGAQIAPGSRLSIGDYGFTIIGVLAPMQAETLNPTDYNDAVFVPLTCVRRALPGADPNVALVRVAAGADAAAIGEAVKARLERPGSTMQVLSARDIIRTMNAQKAVHTRLLASIGGIALLVGGIGVMNVMLMSVMERRREIGLRVAIGATPRDVQLMFVIEAAALTAIGGLLGALSGLAIAYGIARSSGWDFAVALWTLPVGPGVAALMGVVFGAYPAISASRLDPIQALRDD